MNQRIAFFDFDGTITTKDTLLEFIKYSKGKFRFALGFLLTSPWTVAYKLKIISNQTAKEKVLAFFFRNSSLESFQQECDRFAEEIIPALIRPKALEEIAGLQQKGFDVVIVSASPENWIRKWASSVQATLIATRLETKAGRAVAGAITAAGHSTGDLPRTVEPPLLLTGKIAGRNCHGKEKVSRIQAFYSLPGYTEIYAYGDTSGDIPMLSLANRRFMKPFR
jgi:phosphatidylglycerophosphatase C